MIHAEEFEEFSGTLLHIHMLMEVVYKEFLALLGDLLEEFSMAMHADGVFEDGFLFLEGFLN